MNMFSDINIEQGTADFRLLDKNVAEVFRKIEENSFFYRGMVRWLGFKQFGIEYMPSDRFNGKLKYSKIKMLKFALSGIIISKYTFSQNR